MTVKTAPPEGADTSPETMEETRKRRRLTEAERLICVRQAVELLVSQGLSYDEIAEQVKVPGTITSKNPEGLRAWTTRAGCYKAVTKVLREDMTPGLRDLKNKELARLEVYQNKIGVLLSETDSPDEAAKLINAGIKTMQHRGRIVPDLEVDKVAEREQFRIEANAGTTADGAPTLVVNLAVPAKGSDAPYPYETEDDDNGA